MVDKIVLNPVGSLLNTTSAQTSINSNFSTIETAFNDNLSRDGLLPNTMLSPLDMNSNPILNLPAPMSLNSPVRLGDIEGITFNIIVNQVNFTATQIPSNHVGLSNIIVPGYSATGDLGAGAMYTSTNAGPSGPGAIQDAGGVWYNLILTNGVVNVGWFGATGNGLTDDTPAINRAEQAAESLPNGATVYFPPGKYSLTFTNPLLWGNVGGNAYAAIIIGKSNITWQGAGGSSILYVNVWVKYNPGGGQNWFAYVGIGNPTPNFNIISDITIRDLHVLSNYDVNSTFDDYPNLIGVNFFQSSGQSSTNAIGLVNNVNFYNVECEKCGGNPITFSGGDANSTNGEQSFGIGVYNCYLHNSAMASVNAFSSGLADCVISGNKWKDVRNIGCEWSGQRTVFANNVMDNVQTTGFNTDQNSVNDGWCIVANNTFMNCGNTQIGNSVGPAISLGEAAGPMHWSVTGNTIRNNYGGCIVCGGGSISDIYINGNVIDGFGINALGKSWSSDPNKAAINCLNGTNLTVTNNYVKAIGGGNNDPQFGIICGGSGGVNTWCDGNVTSGTFTGVGAVNTVATNYSAGATGNGTNNRVGVNYDITKGQVIPGLNSTNAAFIAQVPVGPGTPNLSGYHAFSVFNSSPQTYTSFAGLAPGESRILYFGDANTTLSAGGNIIVQSDVGGSWTSYTNAIVRVIYDGFNYYCTTIPQGSIVTSHNGVILNTGAGSTTVGSLPAANTNKGARAIVTDSTVVAAANFGAIVAGSSTNTVPVYSDGTNWRIG